MGIETVEVNSGTGIEVAVDLTPEGNVQIFKLSVAPDGDSTPATTIPVSAASLPLPTGAATEASLAAAAASLSVMDDWDESDRVKVNLIAGQAGIAAGTGVDGATVPRVTLATNVALPAGTNAIGKLAANSGVDIGDVDVTSVVGLRSPTSTTGSITGTGQYVGTVNGISTVDYDAVAVFFTGTYNSVTINYEGSLDGGTTWDALTALRRTTDTLENNSGSQTNVTRTHIIPLVGYSLFRVRSSTWTSGTMNVVIQPCRLGVLPQALSSQRAIGDVAHDGVDAGNPLKMGAQARSTDPTAVASADRTNLIADLVGKLITLPYSIPENFIQGATASMTATSRTAVLAAAGAGVRNFVTTIVVMNSHASVGTEVVFEDGTTELFRVYVPPLTTLPPITFPVPIRGSANTAFNATNGTTGSAVRVTAVGYKGV